jgi:alpha-pyrone synthase
MLGLATGNPKYKVYQKDALKVALNAQGCKNVVNILERIYSNTRIKSRYMAVPDFTPEQKKDEDDFFYPEDGSFSLPVQDRLEKFKEVAVPLVTEVAQRAIAQARVPLTKIKKLVVVSSTGLLLIN